MEYSGQDHLRRQADLSFPKIKDKELTRRKLINAVGEIISTKGYTGLGVNTIARQAQVNKKLIYRYFISVDRLIEEYVLEKDYWMLASEKMSSQVLNDDLSETICNILENQFDFFYSQTEMQQLIIWEICGSKLMKSISVAREHLGEKFMELTDEYFDGSDINFRAIGSLLSAGIYYMTLHAPVTPYCGIDLNKPEHRDEVKKTIRQIIRYAFNEAKAKRKDMNGN